MVSVTRRSTLRRALILAAVVLAAAAFVDGFLIEPWWTVRREVTFPCPGLVSGPVRILLIADVRFAGIARRERAVVSAAGDFKPDLVLVAGDLLDSPRALHRSEVAEAAGEFLASLPAGAGRFVVPGEEESPLIEKLRGPLAGEGIDVLVNESRSITVRGESVDLFGADQLTLPAPWGLGTESGRPFVFSRSRHTVEPLVYAGDGADRWGDVDITFSFQTTDTGSELEFRFACSDVGVETPGSGWRLIRHEYRPDFRLYRYHGSRRTLAGRTQSGFVPPPGIWCRARVQLRQDATESRARARFWKEGDPEPEAWAIQATDLAPDHESHGTIAFAGQSGGRRFADLRVSAPDGTVLLEESFRDLPRFRARWRYRNALAEWLREPQRGGQAARVVLGHTPDLVLDLSDIAGPRPDLLLAGHTHGGQVRLPLLGALYTETHIGRRYDFGFFRYEGQPLYITAGLGTSVIPVRFFDPPEITLLTLVPAETAGPSPKKPR